MNKQPDSVFVTQISKMAFCESNVLYQQRQTSKDLMNIREGNRQHKQFEAQVNHARGNQKRLKTEILDQINVRIDPKQEPKSISWAKVFITAFILLIAALWITA